ncbi:MAG: hypothetical protein ACI81P_000687 [Neolewinella sp.]|jgi:hypothetical protein
MSFLTELHRLSVFGAANFVLCYSGHFTIVAACSYCARQLASLVGERSSRK